MNGSKFDVRYVARLAQLDLSEEEAARFQAQLAHVLGYVSALDRVDVSGIDLSVIEAASGNPTRPDVPGPGLTHVEALANAPAHSDAEFLTVRVVD
jgi:aspartyl-tRNA(Asn)/glutamyl-tRNA(Gln) amidotransferase subunit C